MRVFPVVMIVVLSLSTPASADDDRFRLAAPKALIETGLLDYLLPRFSLKTGVRIDVVDETDAAEAALSERAAGTPVFERDETIWHLSKATDPDAAIFLQWLTGSVGRQTIEAFAPVSGPAFVARTAPEANVGVKARTGDAALGERLSLSLCGRCHVVNESNRMKAIGSAPSFALMRTFTDWDARFQSFFVLNPHPAFTQVDGMTEPFSEARPSPIDPIEMDAAAIEAILAYVVTIAPADLGAPIRHQ